MLRMAVNRADLSSNGNEAQVVEAVTAVDSTSRQGCGHQMAEHHSIVDPSFAQGSDTCYGPE